MKLQELRTAFLEYFGKAGHEIVKSAPLVPNNDPTLMFVNAGMVPFKNVFTGLEKRPYVKATSSQKCVRAGGKHNDLDNVGYTARHHTFFEMLGNFSFGDYFKEQAINHAWQFLTDTLGLPADKLYITVYHTDDEAFDIWQKVTGFADDKIIRIDTNDNFWAMGDTGPCGPCSEIFYDHGSHIQGGLPGTPEEDGDRFIEIWNLVFMQYDRQPNGELKPLPKPCVDTGMGLERMAAVMQGVHDNYEVDLFKNLINVIADKTGVAANASHKVIADHLRSSCFLIADGVMPSNEGRGYVLRRIMRRAMRHAYNLGCKQPLMHQLVGNLVTEMGQAFDELPRAQSMIEQVLLNEEERFRQTLGRGLKLLDEELVNIKDSQLSGDIAFKLYDTYGFPLDLTQDILRGQSLTVDVTGFDKCMDEQRQRAKAAWKGSGAQADDAIWFDILEQHGATEFLGYDNTKALGLVQSFIDGDEQVIITNQTPFYAESGGQIGDTGTISNDNFEFKVTDTKKMLGKLHAHIGKVVKGGVKKGDNVNLSIDIERRDNIKANHSATHILHAVLKDVLGEHIAQKGSLVAADRLRFDISHNQAITADELAIIEQKTNAIIASNTPVTTQLMEVEAAIKSGATALFGEKYDDEVRVLSMGLDDYSIELCGGTHVANTGDIGLFKIVVEEAISAGVRRIEAVTGEAAIKHIQASDKLVTELATELKANKEQILDKVLELKEAKKQSEKQIADLRKKLATGGASGDFEGNKLGEYELLTKTFDGLPAKDLRDVVNDKQNQNDNAAILAFATNEGKVSVILSFGKNVKLNANDYIKDIAIKLGGQGGGGKPNFAQAGGADASKIDEAIKCFKEQL